MARPSLPTLTWAHTAVISQTNCTAEQALDHIRALLGTTTYWEDADAGTPTSQGQPFAYIIARPKAGSVTENQRVTIGFRGTSPFSAGSMGVVKEDGTRLGASELALNEMGFNYQPEGGEVGFTAADALQPYGGERSLGWYACTEQIFNLTKTINIYLIESDEVLVVCIEDASSATEEQFGVQCGPMWVGATNQAGDIDNTASVPNRIWGFSLWAQPWVHNWGDKGPNTYDGVWGTWQEGTNGEENRTLCFDPANPTLGLQLGGNQMPAVQAKGSVTPASGFEDVWLSQTGAYVGWDIQFAAYRGLGHVLADPKYLGVWRQIRRGAGLGAGRQDVTSGGVLRAIVRCASGNTAGYDSLWYTNS